MKSTFYLFFALISAVHYVNAQAAENEVTLRFVTFPKTNKPITLTLLSGKDSVEEIEVSCNAISKPLAMPPLSEWVIVKVATTADGDFTGFKTLGKTRSLGSKRQLIIVIRRGSNPEDGYHLIPLNDDGINFGLGKTLIVNASDKRIGGIVGGEKLDVMSGTYKIIEPKANETGRYFHVRFYYEKDGKPKGFYSSNWPFSKQSRVMSFIYNDPHTKQLKFHTIRDYLK